MTGGSVGGLVVTQEDDGRMLRCRPGDVLSVCLREIPTSGYVWEAGVPEDVEVTADRYEERPGTALGGAGNRVFSLRVLRPSDASVEFVLRRPWGGADSAIERVSFVIGSSGG
jgi:predicted secreted protein